MLNALEQSLFYGKNVYTEPPGDCVAYSVKKDEESNRPGHKKTFMDAKSFLSISREYIKAKLNEKGEIKTDRENNIEIAGARNAFYIDLDYYMNANNLEEITTYNKQMAKYFLKSFIDVIKKNNKIKYYCFTFLASEFPMNRIEDDDSYKEIYKGGAHILIYCDINMSNIERKSIYDEIIDDLVSKWKTNALFDISKIYLKGTNGYEAIKNPEESKIINVLRNIFDEQPIKSCNILFPFGQKDPHKRQYTFCKKLSKYNDEPWFILDSPQNKRVTTSVENPFVENFEIKKNFNNILNEMMSHVKESSENLDEFDKEEKKDKLDNDNKFKEYLLKENNIRLYPENLLCPKALVIYDFIGSFKYLSHQHEIWNMLIGNDTNGHEIYYKTICAPYFKLLIILNMWEASDCEDFNKYISTKNNRIDGRVKPIAIYEDILELIARQLANICLTTMQPNGKVEGRFSYSEQLINMRSIFYNYFIEDLFKNNHFSDEIEENKQLENEYLVEIYEKFATKFSTYYEMREYKFNTSSREFKNEVIKSCGFTRITINKIKNTLKDLQTMYLDEIINPFTRLINIFRNGLTNEIEPFNRFRSFSHQVCFINDREDNLIKDDLNNQHEERLSFYNVDPEFSQETRKVVVDYTYENTMQNWVLVILIFKYIESTFQLSSAIKLTVSSFIKRYIAVIMSATNSKSLNNKKILIYNIRQTLEMEKYPYNQWILDSNKSSLVDTWITKLYTHYIRDCLVYDGRNNKLYGFIKVMLNNNAIADNFSLNTIKELPHADKDLTEMLNNIIKTHPTESNNVPQYIPIETSNIFPMRNGWLKFYWKDSNTLTGYEKNKHRDIIFSRDNKYKYTESYTNIPWVGDEKAYLKWIELPENQEAKKAYNKIRAMCESIYPVKSELDYNMALFASVLYGNGQKDVIHIMYGTGSDGKTTIMNALFSMLDAKGYTNDVYIKEHGRLIQIESIAGLASVMKSETLLISPNKGGGHDEGGKNCIAHMRLVSVQEPDQHISHGNLNGAIIKELTSGSAISTRGIFEKAESVQANALITFQTNDLPGTDDTTKGFRRRLSVYTHKSKFKTSDERNEEKSIHNIKNLYEADPTLNESCRKNIFFKQAVFYYLLPYARRNIANGWKDLQKIVKPECVLSDINKIITLSTGEQRWLLDNILEETKYEDNGRKMLPIINFGWLIKYMKDKNSQLDPLQRLWKTVNAKEEKDKLSKALQNYFEGEIFRLKTCYYHDLKNKSSKTIKIKNDVDKDLDKFVNILTNPSIVSEKELKKIESTEKLRTKYLKKHAVTSLSMSKIPTDYSDLFIVGYVVNINRNSEKDKDSFLSDDET